MLSPTRSSSPPNLFESPSRTAGVDPDAALFHAKKNRSKRQIDLLVNAGNLAPLCLNTEIAYQGLCHNGCGWQGLRRSLVVAHRDVSKTLRCIRRIQEHKRAASNHRLCLAD